MEPNAVEAVLLVMLDLLEEGPKSRARATRSLVLQRIHQEWSFDAGEGREAWKDSLYSGLIMEVGTSRRPTLTGEGEAAAMNLRNSVLRAATK